MKNNILKIMFFYFSLQMIIFIEVQANYLKLEPYKFNMSLSQDFLSKIAQKFHAKNFIETGTAFGGTVNTAKGIFNKIYSIEPNEKFYKYCVKRFKKIKNVKLFKGLSENILPNILKSLNDKSVIWLDGHNSPNMISSKDNCPLLTELKHIENSKIKNNIIMIDDIRCLLWRNTNWDHIQSNSEDVKIIFNDIGQGWPDFFEIKKALLKINPNYLLCIYGDVLIAFDSASGIKLTVENNAFMTSFLSQVQEVPLNDLLIAEKIIGSVDDKALRCIQDQVDNLNQFEHPCYHLLMHLWCGLIYLHRGEFIKAENQFNQVKLGGLRNERIDNYLYMAKKNIML